MTYITDILREGDGNVVSVEIEPPEADGGMEKVWKKLDRYVPLGISWINITYHAQRIVGYERQNGHIVPIYRAWKKGTDLVAKDILDRYCNENISVVPHGICTSFSRRETSLYLASLADIDVQNFFPIRGDGIRILQELAGLEEHDVADRVMGDWQEATAKDWVNLPFVPERFGNRSGAQLAQQARDIAQGKYVGVADGKPYPLCIGRPVYTDGYVFPDGTRQPLELQVQYLKEQHERGLFDFLIPQMFMDDDRFLRMRDLLDQEGIDAPMLAAKMPLYAKYNLKVLRSPLFGVIISDQKAAEYEKFPDTKEGKKDFISYSVEDTIKSVERLHSHGVVGIHLYASRGAPVTKVLQNLPFEPFNGKK